MASLEWYPKRTGPGDIDAVGTRKMLGATGLDLADLLVREMAQNSWDARLPSSEAPPLFGVDVRLLDEAASTTLRQHVLTDVPPDLDIVPTESRIRVIEVFDRRTVGLSGPVRNDLPVRRGSERNFIDYVLNVGAPRDQDRGGGTYGYGKTAAYVASRRGVVVIWSRTRHNGQLVHRLIASAIGSQGFTHRGLAHTGRHWWGRVVEDRIEPLVGPDAEVLAGRLFSRGFHGSETGTSVLVVDPHPGSPESGSAEDWTSHWTVKNLTEGIISNLWPKLIKPQPASRAMTIELSVDRDRHDLDPVEPVWQAYAECLRAVRAVQAGEEPTLPMGTVHEIWRKSPRQLLGHLALSRRVRPTDSKPKHHVCLMRNAAELVVKYHEGPVLEDPLFDWVGVFKPVAELDDVFADAEPPAHDDWIPPKGTSPVKVAFTRIKALVGEFVRPPAAAATPLDSRPVAQLADGLADLVGSRAGGRVAAEPAQRPRRKSGEPGPARHEVVELGSRSQPIFGGQRVAVRVRVRAKKPTRITPRVAVVTEGGPDRDDPPVVVQGWRVGGELRAEPDLVAHGEVEAEFVLDAPADIALDVKFAAKEAE